ncbi:glycerol-3-phosphate dehydrogenase/oxidase [Corynebacterium terpenotabidum]|uniref:Glycerol-3-phosphate dehydrogenase n=1 Tax=Corynebacterium terpenotabidum Y-11 TaxID=1200352 RepID=S4XJI3_9CORY|nr:glycerol-3-phosphate dehydrogenase/oxidase [Corynebacterium terpenotabidum]AGP31910.1 glycerol-3-phosphate dehydrogenase [Corynebacterium terpenotabidum Y-11]
MPHFDSDAARLNAARRTRELAELRDHSGNAARGPQRVDVVVIGAGVTGAGIALDAATRGLDVLLVDAHDLAFGTSRWSSKLAHGGLRYLATGNVGIAHRSAKERGILMETTAPHLATRLPQVTPVLSNYSLVGKIAPRLGFLAADGLRIAAGTSGKTLPRSRTVSTKTMKELCPAVRTEGVHLGYVNNDGQLIDDARLVTALARTAAGHGARVLTYCRATDVTSDGAGGGRVTLTDTLAGENSGENSEDATPFQVEAGVIVNATGVWAGGLDPQVKVRPSRGTHLVIDAATVGNPTGALMAAVPGHTSRYCFILPGQLGRCYIGITDEGLDSDGIPDVPDVPESDVRFILDVINQALETALTTDDVIGAFAGLRPLVQFTDSGDDSTADLSREHVILRGKNADGTENNLVTVTGGKLTEYRLMAEQTVDLVSSILRNNGISAGPCVTASTPLVGAPGADGTVGVTRSDVAGLPTSMVDRFGLEAPAVLHDAQVDRPLEPVGTVDGQAVDVVRAELEFHITHEGALTVDDLLDRRTRIGLVAADRAACEATAQEILDAVLPTLV